MNASTFVSTTRSNNNNSNSNVDSAAVTNTIDTTPSSTPKDASSTRIGPVTVEELLQKVEEYSRLH